MHLARFERSGVQVAYEVSAPAVPFGPTDPRRSVNYPNFLTSGHIATSPASDMSRGKQQWASLGVKQIFSPC